MYYVLVARASIALWPLAAEKVHSAYSMVGPYQVLDRVSSNYMTYTYIFYMQQYFLVTKLMQAVRKVSSLHSVAHYCLQ